MSKEKEAIRSKQSKRALAFEELRQPILEHLNAEQKAIEELSDEELNTVADGTSMMRMVVIPYTHTWKACNLL